MEGCGRDLSVVVKGNMKHPCGGGSVLYLDFGGWIQESTGDQIAKNLNAHTHTHTRK